jgi:hypothetical protein
MSWVITNGMGTPSPGERSADSDGLHSDGGGPPPRWSCLKRMGSGVS